MPNMCVQVGGNCVRQEMREIIHLVSGMMTANFFKDNFFILCRFVGFCVYCRWKGVPLLARTKL